MKKLLLVLFLAAGNSLVFAQQKQTAHSTVSSKAETSEAVPSKTAAVKNKATKADRKIKAVKKTGRRLLKTPQDSLSYALGLSMSQFYKEQGVTSLNSKLVAKAITDFFKDKPLLLNEEQAHMSISDYLQNLKKEKAAANKKLGQEFLAKNKTRPGVVTLPSGLQYEIVREGTGPKPLLSDKVKCHYHGTLVDGTVFDSSVDRGQPIDFPVSGVIKGWIEALQLMPVGSKWKLFIPSDLAYGDNQAGPAIQPGSALIFEVELLGIVK